MQDYLMKVLSAIMGVITAAAILFAPLTQKIAQPNFEKAASFEQVVYDEGQLVPELDKDGFWTFTTDRDLKIVQLTDIHIGGGAMSTENDARALNAVAAMLTAEKPDLVVLTGDMVYPVPFQAGTFNNAISTKLLISLMEKLGVYYTVCFGNHDSEFYGTHTREQVSAMWGAPELKYSLYQEGPADVDGFGNHVIKVKNSKGIVKNAYFMLDSNAYTDGDILGLMHKYDNIHANQIAWYKETVLAIDAANKAIDPLCPMFTSLAFFHIPLEEYEIAWEELKANGYKDTENVKYIDGGYHEPNEMVCRGIYSENFFETMLELGSTKGVFCGHDHINNATIEYKGIRLTYGMSIDYLAYPTLFAQGAQRGCTVITLTQNGELSVSLESYYQEKYVTKYPKEDVAMQW